MVFATPAFAQSPTRPPCREVGDVPSTAGEPNFIRIDPATAVERAQIGLDRGRIDPEQVDQLHLTFLRSRTATGNGGRWQALTFSRRAKIVLGVGSVSGVRDGECTTGAPAQAGAESPQRRPSSSVACDLCSPAKAGAQVQAASVTFLAAVPGPRFSPGHVTGPSPRGSTNGQLPISSRPIR
ncbi:MAG TPA: hypothetical protein VFO80_08500 [Sphingomonas sp.]|nr:hypothetical protein [Sphingomonas sp.]